MGGEQGMDSNPISHCALDKVSWLPAQAEGHWTLLPLCLPSKLLTFKMAKSLPFSRLAQWLSPSKLGSDVCCIGSSFPFRFIQKFLYKLRQSSITSWFLQVEDKEAVIFATYVLFGTHPIMKYSYFWINQKVLAVAVGMMKLGAMLTWEMLTPATWRAVRTSGKLVLRNHFYLLLELTHHSPKTGEFKDSKAK